MAQEQNIVGQVKKENLLSADHKDWFMENYNTYDPSLEAIEKLKSLFKKDSYAVSVYFGSWCGDSQREVPRLIKLLEASGFDMEDLKLVGVDRDKVVPNISDKEREFLNVTHVPTIIVYKNGDEINRFVEYAQESLEKDLLNIFFDNPYKHSYQN